MPRFLSLQRLLRTAALVGFGIWLSIAGGNSLAATALSFGVVPHRSALLTALYWNPILAYVEKKTGIVLHLEVSRSVSANATAVENGEYDLAQTLLIFRPKAQRQSYRVLVRPRGAAIRSQLVVLESSPVKSLTELRGREVGFTARSGMIAYAVPMDNLMRQEISVTPVFAGNQEGALGQLRAGETLAAAVSSQVREAYTEREGVQFRVLWESKPFHDLPIAAHPRVPESITRQIQNAFAGMTDEPEGIKALNIAANAIGQKPPYGFVKSTTADYARHADFLRNTLVKDTE